MVSILGGDTRAEEGTVLALIALLLVVWLVVTVIGALVEGLFWLFVVGVVLFLVTAAWGLTQTDTRG
ncbi:hypothetical protein A7K94_0213020 [Modestobacter sp. VKM Ac-2676]|nr:hypothetical protein A7K94_0213020 [Modestobacter sp. VKM Ac-2676]